jgi:hypothetical protein
MKKRRFICIICLFVLAFSCAKNSRQNQVIAKDDRTDGAEELNTGDERRVKLESVKQADSGYSIDGLMLEDRLLFHPVADIPWNVSWDYYDFLVAGNSLIRLFKFEKSGEKVDLAVHDDGYFYYSIFEPDIYHGKMGSRYSAPRTYYLVFIGGGDIATSFPVSDSDGDVYDLKGYYRFDVFPPPAELMQGKDHPLRFFLWEDGIKEIKASSVLRERAADGKEVVYDEKNLRQNFYAMDDGDVHFNFFKKAWAEGVSGDGIGESLDIEFAIATDHILVLNGYVNIFQRDLYKVNNRVKKARIVSKSPEFSIVYEFDDVVKFSEIKFPQKTTGVEFFIEEVYKGEKYSDICITAVLLRQSMEFQDYWYVKGTTEYEEEVDRIIEILVDGGILP